MTDLQRQLAFIKRLVAIEYETKAKRSQSGMTEKLRGLMAIERTVTRLRELEEVSAEILIRTNGELKFRELSAHCKVDTKTVPFSLLPVNENNSVSRYPQAHD